MRHSGAHLPLRWPLMALSPRIELRQSQQLVMTPQLQQAIKLLQMSNLQLADYLAAEVEKSTRFELNARLITLANEVVFLSELLLRTGAR